MASLSYRTQISFNFFSVKSLVQQNLPNLFGIVRNLRASPNTRKPRGLRVEVSHSRDDARREVKQHAAPRVSAFVRIINNDSAAKLISTFHAV